MATRCKAAVDSTEPDATVALGTLAVSSITAFTKRRVHVIADRRRRL